MEIKLRRLEFSDECVRGVLFMFDRIECTTLELPWMDNARNISCIPCGRYRIKPHISPRFKECFFVENVNGRTNILIHAGNTKDDTEGCILVGNGFGELDQKRAITNSRNALDRLLSKLKAVDEEIFITIEGEF